MKLKRAPSSPPMKPITINISKSMAFHSLQVPLVVSSGVHWKRKKTQEKRKKNVNKSISKMTLFFLNSISEHKNKG